MPTPTRTQPRAHSLPIEQAAEDPIAAALALLADTEGTVRVYRKRVGLPNAWVHTYPASEFDVEAVGRDFGGGDYFAQVCGSDRMKTIQGGGTFSIDGPPKARRVQAIAQPFGPFTAPQPTTPDDPVSAALGAILQRLERIEQGGTSGVAPTTPRRDDQPTWRDMIDIATRGAAQSQGASLSEMAKFLEIMRPKSNTEELLQTLTLLRKLNRAELPSASGEDDGGGGLGAILNGPLAQALAKKFLSESDTPAPQRSPRVQQPQQLPAAPRAEPTTPPQTPAPEVLPVQMPKWLADLLPLVASGVLEQLTADPSMTAADIAQGFAATFPETQIREVLAGIPEGSFALSLVKAEAKLQPVALKLIMAEGALREIVAEIDEDDETPEEPRTEANAAAPAPLVPVVAPPTVDAPKVVPSEPKKPKGGKKK
jgi:hypothetical protein